MSETLSKTQPPFQWVEKEEKAITLNSAATTKLAVEPPKMIAVSALIEALSQKEIASHLRGVELGEELAKALRYSVRLSEMKTVMAELRYLLDGDQARKRYYQKWCENHPWAFGNQFVANDEIRNISVQDQVDLLMPRLLAGFRDIVEPKRPIKRFCSMTKLTEITSSLQTFPKPSVNATATLTYLARPLARACSETSILSPTIQKLR